MRIEYLFPLTIIFLLFTAVLAVPPNRDIMAETDRAIGSTCDVGFNYPKGDCEDAGRCFARGGSFAIPGYCPNDPNWVQCCLKFEGCTALGTNGICTTIQVCKTTGRRSVPGLCPGPGNVQCCVRA